MVLAFLHRSLHLINIYNSRSSLIRSVCSLKQCYIIDHETSYSQEIRKSKFVGFAAPARSLEDAMLYIARIQDVKATHNCWAFRSATTSRSSDNGEPAGTAGRPMLHVLESENLVNTVVVVSRYYGGVKLGTGGLARAYSSTVVGAIALQQPQLVVHSCVVKVTLNIDSIGSAYKLFQQCETKYRAFFKLKESFKTFNEDGKETANVEFLLRIPVDEMQGFETSLHNLCKGKGVVCLVEDEKHDSHVQ